MLLLSIATHIAGAIKRQLFSVQRRSGLSLWIKKACVQQALGEIEKTQWIPDWGQSRIEKMVENRPDWCISRQRTWGVPITLFVHRETRRAAPR